MSEVSKVFDNNFVLRTVNDKDDLNLVTNTRLEIRPADYEEPQNTPKSTKFQKIKSFLKDKNANIEDEPKYIDGKTYMFGDRYCIGNPFNKISNEKSYGNLVALPVYHQYGDDMIGRYYPSFKGYVVLDNNLNIVYKQCSNSSDVLESPGDCLALLYKYGPCALSFLKEKDFESRTLFDEIKQTFDKRVEKLKDNGVLDYKIEKEQKQFEECCKIIENLQSNTNEMQ